MEAWRWDEQQLRQWQLQQLNLQLAAILPENAFYRSKLGCEQLQLQSLEQLSQLPLTTKQELVASADETPDRVSRHHTYAAHRY